MSAKDSTIKNQHSIESCDSGETDDDYDDVENNSEEVCNDGERHRKIGAQLQNSFFIKTQVSTNERTKQAPIDVNTDKTPSSPSTQRRVGRDMTAEASRSFQQSDAVNNPFHALIVTTERQTEKEGDSPTRGDKSVMRETTGYPEEGSRHTSSSTDSRTSLTPGELACMNGDFNSLEAVVSEGVGAQERRTCPNQTKNANG